jgi:hypothetical protein
LVLYWERELLLSIFIIANAIAAVIISRCNWGSDYLCGQASTAIEMFVVDRGNTFLCAGPEN